MAHVEHRGVRIQYVVEGAGQPVVLQHGFTDSGLGMYLQGWVEALADRFRVVMIDARGHGGSDKPHDPADYARGRRIGDVLAVLDALDIDHAHYVGYSMGGWIGFGLASRAPERLRSVALGGAHPYAERLDPLREALAHGLQGWVAAVERSAGPLDPSFRAALLDNDLEALQACIAKDRTAQPEDLGKLCLPVLLYVGSNDPRRPLVERAARVIPQARLVVVPDVDHLQLAVHGDAIHSVVRAFLLEHSAHQARS